MLAVNVAPVTTSTVISPAGAEGSAGRSSRRPRRSSIRVTVADPGSGYGLQVGDTLTITALVHDPDVAAARGVVEFSSDDGYDTSCRSVRLHRSKAVCYLTFYSPGTFFVTARYVGSDRSTASVTLHFPVIPSTDD